MKIEQATISYTVKLLIGDNQGQKIKFGIDLDDLEESDISDYLIENEYLDSCGWPTDAYEVLERKIVNLQQ